MSDMTAPCNTSGEQAVTDLALDLHWTWNHATDRLWRQLAPDIWDHTRNAWAVLLNTPRSRLRALLATPDFRDMLDQLVRAHAESREKPAWFMQACTMAPPPTIAYFSMEYMLDEALPIYSGGLGNVAGDQLKAASDLGVPVVAVGLLYAQGYFRQGFSATGQQEALYPINDPAQLPITPVCDGNGDRLRVPFRIATGQIWLRAWRARVGRTVLYLLDTNDPDNPPAIRCITTQLYGGDDTLRLRQEMVLGIGGWRLLRVLGLRPDVCHLNEGHAAFAALERACGLMEDLGIPFVHALTIARAGTVFTTHTAVPAGFDRFAPELVRRHLDFYACHDLRTDIAEILALGQGEGAAPDAPFNMAWLALRVSGAVNAVSRLHEQVSRALFNPQFPRWPQGEVPVSHVTNGVHVPTWDSAAADALWTSATGKDRWLGTLEEVEHGVRAIPDHDLWHSRMQARAALVGFMVGQHSARACFMGGRHECGMPPPAFAPDVLTIGFARRFATYKRPDLLLHDPDRLARILTRADRPVQLVIAGKAHPRDMAGQALITRWMEFIRRPDVQGHATFLVDYDMSIARRLVEGVDLWINTPLRPWEACGTSGMKVLVNGGLNVSEPDGWWAEAGAPEVGWVIGDGMDHGGAPSRDAHDADSLYTLLEHEIVPLFYQRDGEGVPRDWVAIMRESMARLTPRFSANRAVRDYTHGFYLPAATAYRARLADGGAKAADIGRWRQAMAAGWADIRFGTLQVTRVADRWRIHVDLHLGSITPDMVRVQLYADVPAGSPIVVPMTPGAGGRDGSVSYGAEVDASRPATDYTPRVTGFHPDVSIPLEASFIAWQK
ncbi:alpha-glucan phosphorylase [Komagataeibacter xylinus NBRC 13693]|uniref:Alpha-glucan phosphorylase n=1 Tax=Komagataeibacter xylinus NBRC 13693 TaxID=1234668 RepID=A0A0D6Q6X0_KOMXY|nr:alpha-glucan family phosphorylase [Komagataeibacter xylinus]GAN99277.1 alpha-glucan phosphorylase [Komagataeibacter xylinus NBRC 13693]